jgi:Tat protein secretion system quality control protein TatD with DNase activity
MDLLPHHGIRFGKMGGIHPCDVTANTEKEQHLLEEACSADDIIAVGETGIDYYWSRGLDGRAAHKFSASPKDRFRHIKTSRNPQPR